jgi:osmotically-inducible protein OsmY
VTLATGVEQVVALARGPEFGPTEASRRLLGDRALAARVRAALKARPETASVEVELHADGGQLRLSGTVASDAEREATVAVAGAVAGVESVDDRLQVVRMPVL